MLDFNKINILYKFISFCDAATPWQMRIQDPATPVAEGMIIFHDYLAFFLVFIGVSVFWILGDIIAEFDEKVHPHPLVFTHSSLLEIVWTIIPAIILVFIAVPSFTLLYSIDELIEPEVTIKIIGHQWYWTYEYSDYTNYSCVIQDKRVYFNGASYTFDSYMVPTSDLRDGRLRLLETDLKLIIPYRTHVRLLVTSADVLHSWAVPSFGIKIDACPGRLSQGALFAKRYGHFYGQCSEICGVNHGFMPIAVNVAGSQEYFIWMLQTLAKQVDPDAFLPKPPKKRGGFIFF